MGLLVSTTSGRQKYYQANQKSPIFIELHGLMLKISGCTPIFFGSRPDANRDPFFSLVTDCPALFPGSHPERSEGSLNTLPFAINKLPGNFPANASQTQTPMPPQNNHDKK
jgi:hypothetical protein